MCRCAEVHVLPVKQVKMQPLSFRRFIPTQHKIPNGYHLCPFICEYILMEAITRFPFYGSIPMISDPTKSLFK